MGEGNYSLQGSVDVFLHGCTGLDEEGTIILLQPYVEVDDGENTTTSEQATAREEFARPSKKRQQQRMAAWGNDQTKQFDPRYMEYYIFFRCTVCPYVLFSLLFLFSCIFLFFLVFVCNFPKQVRKARRIFTQGWERLGYAPDA